jgi:hypothetical protein
MIPLRFILNALNGCRRFKAGALARAIPHVKMLHLSGCGFSMKIAAELSISPFGLNSEPDPVAVFLLEMFFAQRP